MPPCSQYVELGALDGSTFSNTKFFDETLGWGGVLIEPSPRNFEKLKVMRNNKRNTLINSAVCGQSGTIEWRYAGGSSRTQAMSGVRIAAFYPTSGTLPRLRLFSPHTQRSRDV